MLPADDAEALETSAWLEEIEAAIDRPVATEGQELATSKGDIPDTWTPERGWHSRSIGGQEDDDLPDEDLGPPPGITGF